MVNNTSFILYFACVFLLTAAGFGMVAISLNDFPALLLKCCICETSDPTHWVGGFPPVSIDFFDFSYFC